MRIFAYIVSVLSLIACCACLISIPKFQAIYEDMGVELPVLSRIIVSHGGLLGGLFLLLAITLVVLGSIDKPKLAGSAAGVVLLLLLVSGVLVPVALMLPMTTVIQALDDSGADQDVPPEAP